MRRARTRFQTALRDDPRSVIALNGLGATYSMERNDLMNQLTVEQVAEHERVVDRARALAPDDATALLSWGLMQIMRYFQGVLDAEVSHSRLEPMDFSP